MAIKSPQSTRLQTKYSVYYPVADFDIFSHNEVMGLLRYGERGLVICRDYAKGQSRNAPVSVLSISRLSDYTSIQSTLEYTEYVYRV